MHDMLISPEIDTVNKRSVDLNVVYFMIPNETQEKGPKQKTTLKTCRVVKDMI